MKRSASLGRNDLVGLWLACSFVLVAGWYVTFYRLGAAIDAEQERHVRLAAAVRTNAHLRGTLGNLQTTERQLDARIDALALGADHTETVARAIRETAHIAGDHHVDVVQIDEHAGATSDAATTNHPPVSAPATFDNIPLDMTLRGTYRDLLATVRGLARGSPALAIEIAAIERTGGPDASTHDVPLTARLTVNVERLPDPISPPPPLPEARPDARSL